LESERPYGEPHDCDYHGCSLCEQALINKLQEWSDWDATRPVLPERLHKALAQLRIHYDPICGELWRLLNYKEAAVVKEVVDAWLEIKEGRLVEGRPSEDAEASNGGRTRRPDVGSGDRLGDGSDLLSDH
jgi:hypothetical protein